MLKQKEKYYGFMKKKFEIAAAGGTGSLAGAVSYCGPDTKNGTSYFQPNPNTRNQGTRAQALQGRRLKGFG
jgi:hypothetical protein